MADDEVTGERSRIEDVTLGQAAKGGKIAYAVGAGAIVLAGAIVAIAWSQYERKADAKVTHDRQDAAIAKAQNAAEVEKEVRVIILDEIRLLRRQVNKIAEKVRAEKVAEDERP